MLNGKPITGVPLMLLLILAGTSVFSFIGFVISELFLDIPLLSDPNLIEDLTNPELIPALRVMQVFQAIGMLIVPAAVYVWITSSTFDLKAMFAAPFRQPVLLSIALFIVAFPFINYISHWNAGLDLPAWMSAKEGQAEAITKLSLDRPNAGLLLFNLFMIAFLPAIGEELIFRGIIQRGLIRQFGNPHLAVWVVGILFSAVHMQFLGFVPRMLMGVALGYLCLWSKNLWYPIIAHFANNALAVILAFGTQHHAIDPELENSGIENAGIAGFSLAFCMVLLYLFKQQQESRAKIQT